MAWPIWSIWDSLAWYPCLKTGERHELDRWTTQWRRNLLDGHIQWELRSMSWCQSGKQWGDFLRGHYWDQCSSASLLETWTVGLTIVWTVQATWRCAGICILGDTQNLTGCGLSAVVAAPTWAVFKGAFQPQRLCDLACAVKQMLSLIYLQFFSCFLWLSPLSNIHLNTCRLCSNVTYPVKVGWYLYSQI